MLNCNSQFGNHCEGRIPPQRPHFRCSYGLTVHLSKSLRTLRLAARPSTVFTLLNHCEFCIVVVFFRPSRGKNQNSNDFAQILLTPSGPPGGPDSPASTPRPQDCGVRGGQLFATPLALILRLAGTTHPQGHDHNLDLKSKSHPVECYLVPNREVGNLSRTARRFQVQKSANCTFFLAARPFDTTIIT